MTELPRVTELSRFVTSWVTVPACVWNEHEHELVPAGCDWVLVGRSVDAFTFRELARMGFALTPALLEEHTMDSFIDSVAYPAMVAAVDRVRPVGDLLVNETIRFGDPGEPWS